MRIAGSVKIGLYSVLMWVNAACVSESAGQSAGSARKPALADV